jgi:hypothetical protein
MLRRFPVGGFAVLVALVIAAAIPTEAAAWTEKTSKNCNRTCEWKCSTIGAFGRCLGKWVKRCAEERCLRQSY